MTVIAWLTGSALTPEIERQMQESARAPFNSGYSLGLQYPWLFGRHGDHWEVWCKYCNVLHSLHEHDNEVLARFAAMEACHQANGLSQWPTQDVINAMDTTP
jgi:hypothetical protein